MSQTTGLADEAYHQIRKLILTGALPARSRLSQRALAKQLGVSTMPVVEALRQLEQDGLVERLPQYGAYVKEWTADDVEEAFLLRRALEGEAARQMAQRATPAEKQTLLELSNRLDAAMHEGRSPDVVELELAFHLYLARAARLPKLYQMLETAHVLLRSLHMWPGRLEVGFERLGNHHPIARAIADGDALSAQQAIFDHIDSALQVFQEHQLKAETATPQSSVMPLRLLRPEHNPANSDLVEVARGWLHSSNHSIK